MALLDDVKNYIRIDTNDDDVLLASLIATARTFILNATGYLVDENTSDLDKLTLMMTVAHFYTNRDYIVATGAVPQKIPMTIQSLYSQLQRLQDGIDNPVTTT